jgi:hypothetical protein
MAEFIAQRLGDDGADEEEGGGHVSLYSASLGVAP